MKKFILVLNDEIVLRYEATEEQYYGGAWSVAISIEVPQEMNLWRVVYVDGVVSEPPFTEQELFQQDVNDSEPYYQKITKGQRAIAFFRCLNDKKGLSEAQKMELTIDPDIQNIIQFLMIGNIEKSLELIDELTADGVLILESDKTKLTKYLEEY